MKSHKYWSIGALITIGSVVEKDYDLALLVEK